MIPAGEKVKRISKNGVSDTWRTLIKKSENKEKSTNKGRKKFM